MALWTAATSQWAHCVARKYCRAVQGEHECTSVKCSQTFRFVFSGDKMRFQKIMASDWEEGCGWCELYSRRCRRCTCHIMLLPTIHVGTPRIWAIYGMSKNTSLRYSLANVHRSWRTHHSNAFAITGTALK